MANYNGFDEGIITVEADAGLTAVGVPVKITDTGKAAKCSADDVFCGVCVNLRNGYAGIAVKGYVELPLTGTCTAGYNKLAVGDNDTVAVSQNGREYLVLESGNGKIGFIL